MNGVFWLMILILGVDITLTLCRDNDISAGKIHAVFSGIVSVIGVIGAVSVPFALRFALRAEQAAASYMDAAFVNGILSRYDRFSLLITVLCVITGAVMLWNGMCRHRKNQMLLWCLFGAALQLVTLICGLNTINAYFDGAIYMNSLFLFEGMALHLVNTILHCREKKPLI